MKKFKSPAHLAQMPQSTFGKREQVFCATARKTRKNNI